MRKHSYNFVKNYLAEREILLKETSKNLVFLVFELESWLVILTSYLFGGANLMSYWLGDLVRVVTPS